jgi:Zn-finger nucleic acid-binding protein
MSINCPKCNVATTPFNLDADLTFDKCEECFGMWMDKGELGRTAGDTHDFIDHDKAMNGPKTNLLCPKCPPVTNLHETVYAPGTKLIVEVCKTCEGVWLDSRELVQIQGILRKHRIEQKKKRVQSL